MRTTKKQWKKMAGYLAGEMSDEQAKEFRSKIESDQQQKKEYELMKTSWDKFNSNPAEKYMDTGKAWEALSRRMENDGLMQEHTPVIRMDRVHYALRIAAVALLLLAVGIPAIYYTANHSRTNDLLEYSSPEGILTVDLPDGSRVFLNEGAKLQYDGTMEEQREVTLKGEGYFDVAADNNRPFLVNAGKVTVTVLGTSFNVRQTANAPVEVFVESGSVRLDLKKEKQSITLGPGQLGQASESLMISKMEDLNYLAWKTLDFKFVDQSVEEVLRILEKAYHVDVRMEKIEDAGMRLTTSYSDQPFDTILNTICTALNISYIKEGKVYILQPN
jgi:ferric-dicitrate binding protein FerR (iron transport regulator)